MNKAFLGIALAAHQLWLRDDERGNRFCAPRGSDLRYSNLSGSNRIVGPQRSDGYLFTYCLATKTVRAGCQTKSIQDYIEHCNTYGNAEKKAETLAILKCLELLISARSAQ